MRTLAILPMKSFDAAKQRLADALPRGSRQALVRAMFGDVVASLRRCRRIEGAIVVTGDSQAAAAASADRLEVVHDHLSEGQAPAAKLGVARAMERGAERVVMVPGDTPLLEAADLDRLLDRCEARGLAAAIVPDRHGTGTNALVLSPPDAIGPRFGPGSLELHAAAAREAEIPHAVEPVRSLGLDVDTPDDLMAAVAALERHRVPAPLTRGAIRQLERFGRLPESREPQPNQGTPRGATDAVEV